MSSGEIILPFPVPEAKLGLVTETRSTLIASSIVSLRRHGLYDRYQALLSSHYRDTVLSSVAGVWLPMPVVRAHYEACDRLGLSTQEHVEIGAEVSQKIHETFLGVVVRMAKQAGVTPWTLLSRGHNMFGRLFQGGGGVRVIQFGPKEARADIAGIDLFDIPYFRDALRGIYLGAVSLFCTQAYVHEIQRESTPSRVALTVSWV